MEELWITQGPREFAGWLKKTGADRKAARRIERGLEITAAGEIPQQAGAQLPEVFFPGLQARPWWEPSDFPWVRHLEESAPGIVTELRAFGDQEAEPGTFHPPELATGGQWRALYLSCAGRADSNVRSFPVSSGALARVPGGIDCGMAYFSSITEGVHIAPHTGFTNAQLRCHLSLMHSGGSRIRVADEERVWSDGKVLIFDDTYEHEVWNEGTEKRTVLLFDFWHPDLSAAEIVALTFVMGMWRRMYARHFWAQQLTA